MRHPNRPTSQRQSDILVEDAVEELVEFFLVGRRPVIGVARRSKGAPLAIRVMPPASGLENAFGWIKAVPGLSKAEVRGLAKVDWASPLRRSLTI